MTTIEKASLAVQALNAPLINTLFKESVQGVHVTFGNNQQVQELVTHTLKQIP